MRSHVYVHDNDVDLLVLAQVEDLVAVSCLADDINVPRSFQKGSDPSMNIWWSSAMRIFTMTFEKNP
jgi:hypothetical protein